MPVVIKSKATGEIVPLAQFLASGFQWEDSPDLSKSPNVHTSEGSRGQHTIKGVEAQETETETIAPIHTAIDKLTFTFPSLEAEFHKDSLYQFGGHVKTTLRSVPLPAGYGWTKPDDRSDGYRQRLRVHRLSNKQMVLDIMFNPVTPERNYFRVEMTPDHLSAGDFDLIRGVLSVLGEQFLADFSAIKLTRADFAADFSGVSLHHLLLSRPKAQNHTLYKTKSAGITHEFTLTGGYLGSLESNQFVRFYAHHGLTRIELHCGYSHGEELSAFPGKSPIEQLRVDHMPDIASVVESYVTAPKGFSKAFCALVREEGLDAAIKDMEFPPELEKLLRKKLKSNLNLWDGPAMKAACASDFAGVIAQLFPTEHTLH